MPAPSPSLASKIASLEPTCPMERGERKVLHRGLISSTRSLKALRFLTQVALIAESMGTTTRSWQCYNRVTIDLTTQTPMDLLLDVDLPRGSTALLKSNERLTA